MRKKIKVYEEIAYYDAFEFQENLNFNVPADADKFISSHILKENIKIDHPEKFIVFDWFSQKTEYELFGDESTYLQQTSNSHYIIRANGNITVYKFLEEKEVDTILTYKVRYKLQLDDVTYLSEEELFTDETSANRTFFNKEVELMKRLNTKYYTEEKNLDNFDRMYIKIQDDNNNKLMIYFAEKYVIQLIYQQ